MSKINHFATNFEKHARDLVHKIEKNTNTFKKLLLSRY